MANYTTLTSDKKRGVALILCLFLGVFGAHNFYVGKVGKGILYLCTAGLFGIGALVDLIQIILGTFTDNAHQHLRDWGDKKQITKVGIIAFAVFIIICLIGSAAAKSANKSNVAKEAEKAAVQELAEKDGLYTFDNCTLKYTDYLLSKDEYDDNKDVLVLNFDYTNTKDTAEEFDYAVEIKVFQNGVELESPFSTSGIEKYNIDNNGKKIKTDTTISVQRGYYLDDKSSVTVELYNNMFSDKPTYSFDVEIK